MNVKTHWLAAVGLAALAVTNTGAKQPDGGGDYPFAAPTDRISEQMRADIKRNINQNLALLDAQGRLPAARGDTVSFDWPLATAPWVGDAGVHGISNFVDQNAAAPNQLLDYNCGARTYDTPSGYNHQGIDFFTWPYGWKKMDQEDVRIVAAAAGIVAFKSDGNFDRQCGFNSENWNAVYIRHADDSITWYGHMKSGSVTSKNVGDSVAAGEVLGVVGSSGSSTGPHLHMETYDSNSNLIEPYAGACNAFNANSWWSAQREYYDSALNSVTTGFAAPNFPACPTTEQPNTRRVFVPGEPIFLATFYRDQLASQTSNHTLRFPNGSVASSWPFNSNAAHYTASYWYWTIQAQNNGPFGTWSFTVDFEGTTTVREFEVVPPGDSDNDGLSDHLDNCMASANASQLDADADGYGNACDADFNNDGVVNVVDLGYLRTVFFSADALADLDGNGSVNVVDLGILRTLFFQAPGPSAFAP